MTRDIRPMDPEDIPELGQFLALGFQTSTDADFVAPEVLRWKYLESESGTGSGADATNSATAPDPPRSYVARGDDGRIIGHLGICRTAFEGRALSHLGGRVETIHIIDWLGSPEHRAIGMSLMRRAHTGVPTQFGLGVSPSALVVGERAGYELRTLVPAYARTLRTGYWLRSRDGNAAQRMLRLARDAADRLIHPPSRPRVSIIPRRVERFGPEIDPIVTSACEHAILTTRSPERLNGFLRFPRQSVSGWHLVDQSGKLRGLAILNIIPKDSGRTQTGKVVDCLLDGIDIDDWHAAFVALTAELKHQGADNALAYGSTPWSSEALQRAGYRSRYTVKFHIRDRDGLIPKGVPFHLTPMEGDYGYT